MTRGGTILLASLILTTTPAFAYRTAGDLSEFSGTERVRWSTPAISYERYGEPPPGLTSETVRDTLIQAFGAWSAPACSALVFDNQGVAPLPAAPNDRTNTVQWLNAGWLVLGAPSDAPALTDVHYERTSDGSWQIVEADLYLNAEHHSWAASGGGDGVRDLLSVATHEAGHMLGLLHPCELDRTSKAPDCGSVPIVSDSTMFPAYSPEQATLAADDEAGVCFLYPAADCEGQCPTGTTCTPVGCRTSCGTSYCEEHEVCRDHECVSAGPNDGGTAICAADEDCSDALRCDHGSCRPGTGLLGDPCATNRDCAHARCHDAGYCAKPCETDAGCRDAGHCDTTLPEPVCVSDARPLGATCSEANECLGQQCLAGLTREPVCTRLCSEGCPDGWECDRVEDRDVCSPALELTAHGGGGCRLAPQQRSPSGAGWLIPVLALELRRRLRRVSRHEEQ